jgi:hypothetical protein
MTDERLPPPPVEPLPDLTWARLERQLWATLDAPVVVAPPSPRARWRWPVAAAVSVAAAAAVALAWPSRPGDGAELTSRAPTTMPSRVATAAAETELSVGDASIRLAPFSALYLHGGDRGVGMILDRGQASFEVAPADGSTALRRRRRRGPGHGGRHRLHRDPTRGRRDRRRPPWRGRGAGRRPAGAGARRRVVGRRGRAPDRDGGDGCGCAAYRAYRWAAYRWAGYRWAACSWAGSVDGGPSARDRSRAADAARAPPRRAAGPGRRRQGRLRRRPPPSRRPIPRPPWPRIRPWPLVGGPGLPMGCTRPLAWPSSAATTAAPAPWRSATCERTRRAATPRTPVRCSNACRTERLPR